MKPLLTLLATALLAAPALHAAPVLSNARPSRTPYDPYMQPVDSVLRRLNGKKPSMERVAALLREAYSFRYVYDTPYLATPPHITEARREGDCKAKSLWMAREMNDPNVRYVIGKAHRNSRISHAWLMWHHNGQWWVLDPTNLSRPVPASRTSPDEYLVNYSYTKAGSFRHAPTGRRAVAGQR